MRRVPTALTAVALLLAACGGSTTDDGVATLSDSTTTTAAAGETRTDEEALLAFTQCMRDQGIDVPDPTVDAQGNLQFPQGDGDGPAGPEDFDQEALQEAFSVCGDLLEGVTLGFFGFDRTEIEDRLLEFAVCMRENGYDMPDPDFSAFPFGSGEEGDEGPDFDGPFGPIDFNDPDLQAALEACQDILAGFGQGPGGGSEDSVGDSDG